MRENHLSVSKNRWPGQGLIEYAIILAVLTMVGIAGVRTLNNIPHGEDKLLSSLNANSPAPTPPASYCKADMATTNGWDVQSGNSTALTSKDGQICLDGNGTETFAFNDCSKAWMPDSSDYEVRVDAATLMKGKGYGIVLRASNYSTTPNAYIFQYDPGLTGFVFRKWKNGGESVLDIYYPPVNYNWFNTPRDIVVQIKGDTMSAYIDGQLVLVAKDSEYKSGAVGLRTWGSSAACFGGVQVGPVN
jgi:hypothetical protein